MTTQLSLMPDPIDVAFLDFHHANPHVYARLVAELETLAVAGVGRVSMRDLFGLLRVERLRTTGDADGFALNNNMTSRYARLIGGNRADLAAMITTRQLHTASAVADRHQVAA